MSKSPRERAARALCHFNNVPEDTKFEGAPMWQSYLPEVDAVLEASGFPELASIKAKDEASARSKAPNLPTLSDAQWEKIERGTPRNYRDKS